MNRLALVSAGTKEPVRVTYSDGFDGLPVPAPDGTQTAFTSARPGGGAGQIFLAQWNHEAARKAIQSAPPRKKTIAPKFSRGWGD